MGTVTSSTVLRPNGTVERIQGRPTGPDGQDARVLFHYDYVPGLLPAPAHPEVGMWRWRDLLPLDTEPIRYPLLVGGTPLVASPRLREITGLPELWLKDETRSPTGSNKDRATALVLDHALRNGVQMVSCASTGNVGVSLSVGCGAVGINAVIFVPATVLDSKLSIMLAAGARVLKVAEGYEAAFRLSEEAAAAFGWGNRNTGVNPLTIEAKKTVAFEIWEQLGRELPDAIIVPVGDGPTLTALAKGFYELQLCGIDQQLPRIIGVQAAGCQPVKRAWERGGRVQPEVPNTIADGIAVSNPVAADLVIQDIRATNGAFVAVTDDEMLDAMQTLAAHSGIVAEPAGAAAFAGLMQALHSGLVDPNERVVALVTGTGFKTPQFLRPSAAVATVHENLRDVEQALVDFQK